MKRRYTAVLVVILLVATGLRFYRLDAQSFWNDEGNTARLVERPVALIIKGAAGDIHPPGYYLLLHVWRAFAGASEFALRAFSALCGVLTVAVTVAIGQRVGGWRTALAAALFLAVHPLSIYYSQETRMYALLGLASALTLLCSLKFQVESRKSRIHSQPSPTPNSLRPTPYSLLPTYSLLLALSIALGLYTQYAYIFVLVGLNLAFGVDWALRRPWEWRVLWRWIAAHALGGLAFLPWAPIALEASGWRPPDLDSARAVQEIARALLVGITLPAKTAPWLIGCGALLLLLALLTRARSRFGAWAALGMALVPPALLIVFGLYRPAYLKFMLAAVAPLAVVLALPCSRPPSPEAGSVRQRVRNWLAGLLLLALLWPQLTSQQYLYTDPAYARDDYRGIAARIAAEARPGDAILLSAPNQWEVFTYYYRGPLPVYPAPYRPDPSRAAQWVDEITAQHTRLFILFWGDAESDPERRIEPYLARNAYKASDVWISTVRLALYGTGALPDTPAVFLNARLGDSIVLEGYALPQTVFSPGDIIPLTLFWRAEETPAERYKVFVHLTNADGALVAQTDAEPGGGFALTTLWQPGERLRDRYGVLAPPDSAPGEYRLLVGMYGFSGERLPVTVNDQPAGDALPLMTLTVASPR
ncbi:MAG TPA: glycosyltransferase family 39 protein [Anaerolineae bacterium]|nr:glycosyltransferase family 39 protein [Anaerolineae bacterium]HQI86543.1 glycosyltransferase family 39 protein [Anaerolineae bacterium]